MREGILRRWALIAMVGGAVGIGVAPVLVKLSEVGPSATAAYRLLFALPLLWLWAGVEARRSPELRRPRTRHDFGWLAVAGLFFAADLGVWHWSLRFTSVANSTLLTNFAPVFVTLGARWLFAERITGTFVAGLATAFAGAVLLVGARFQWDQLLGDGLALGTATFYAGYLLTVKQLRRVFSSATVMSWSGLVSCPALFLAAWGSRETLMPGTSQGWLVLLALALISHVGGQTLIAFALGHLPASFSAVTLLLQPVVAAFLAWVILDEPLTPLQVVGGLVVLGGIALAQRGSAKG